MYFQPTESIDAKDRTKALPESLYIPHPDEVNGFELVEKYLTDEQRPSEKTEAPTRKKIIIRKK